MAALDLRPSAIAGTWYEGSPKPLAEKIDAYLDEAKIPELDGQIVGVIAPHAGHKYSGRVAAHAFAALRGLEPEIVAVLSPYHDFAPYSLIVTKHRAYSTPLGNLEVDVSALEDLQNLLDTPLTRLANDKEHSLEIELPFLQRVFRHEFKLLPVMMRDQREDTARKLGEALGQILQNRSAVLVASTDLSHFYDQQTAAILDGHMLKCIEAFDPYAVFEAERTGRGFACGHAAVAAAMWASRRLGADRVKILHYATSGSVTKDYSSVVGYGAAAFLKPI
jgi:hypothetical protein